MTVFDERCLVVRAIVIALYRQIVQIYLEVAAASFDGRAMTTSIVDRYTAAGCRVEVRRAVWWAFKW